MVRPAARNGATAASKVSACRAATTTRAPTPANSAVRALPSPREPPVINATLSCQYDIGTTAAPQRAEWTQKAARAARRISPFRIDSKSTQTTAEWKGCRPTRRTLAEMWFPRRFLGAELVGQTLRPAAHRVGLLVADELF